MKIRHKITLWVAGAGLLTSLVVSMVVFWEMREQPLEILDAELQSTAHALAARLDMEPGLVDAAREKALFVPSVRYWIKIYDPGLHLFFRSDLTALVDLPLYRNRRGLGYTITVPVADGRGLLHPDDEGNVAFRVRIVKVSIRGSPCLVQIAKPMEKLEEENSDLLAALGIGLALSTVFLVIISFIFAGRIIAPVAAIGRLTREIDENTLEKRIPLGSSRDELHALSTSLNRMFDRLQYSFSRQKQFVANASHELKTPVAMLRLFFEESTQREDLPESFRDQLDLQGRNVLRMDRLVKNLLELSVLELRNAPAQEVFDLSAMIRSVLEDFTPLMTAERIRLTVELPAEVNFRGDPDMIRRVLINIVDNALKYNVKDGEIRLKAEEREGAVHLFLFNTGPGIPAGECEMVFDQFYRVEKSRSLQYGGAGLGLAIVKEIVRLHRGQVAMDSALGAWSRIRIVLPREG